MTINAVMLDAFGTLLKIQNGVHPYRQILQRGRKQGRRPQLDDAHTLMTRRLGLAEAADFLSQGQYRGFANYPGVSRRY
jgi:hypothetical protein